MDSIGEVIRQAEDDFIRGTTQSSKYVSFSIYETLERIDAYLNSKHISGETDSLGREKPFFNVVVAASNIWHRGTDIDRKHIKVRATKERDYIKSFLATVILQNWMKKENFGAFLNEWGRTLARYGSAVVKFVDNSEGLHITVIPWNRLIIDSVDFDGNVKVEIIELTEGQLRARIKTHGYDKEKVDALVDVQKPRETTDKQRKDNKSNYIKLYEAHGLLSKFFITGKEKDKTEFVQQMHVISYVGKKNGRKTDYTDFTLFAGEEERDPYMITHLIREDGRSLAIGAVERLFETQWMQNHSMKAIKDALDISSKLMFQTSDSRFVGRNVLKSIESGTILITDDNKPLNPVNSQVHDLVGWQNYAVQWKNVGNELTNISEAMLGAEPKSGTAWRQTEALLSESYSLFELMTENKGLYLIEMLRSRVIPRLKKQIDTKDEIAAILESHDLDQIDSIYVPRKATKNYNKRVSDELFAALQDTNAPTPSPFNQQQEEQAVRSELSPFGNTRFFSPSSISDETWKDVLKDLEWELDIDVTGEVRNIQEVATTLNTALTVVMNPGYAQNKQAQMIVGSILELTGAVSPLKLAAIQNAESAGAQVGGGVPNVEVLPKGVNERNIENVGA